MYWHFGSPREKEQSEFFTGYSSVYLPGFANPSPGKYDDFML